MNKTFRGGIQKGTTALDEDSRRLDVSAKEARDILAEEFSNLTLIKTMSKDLKISLVGDDCFGFSPDGGAWFDSSGKLVASFECKKQGMQGNAYERWWDNAITSKYINENVIYVTFCTGEGAEPGNCLDKLSRKAKIMLGDNFRFHMSPNGFTDDEILEIMRNTLKEFT